MFLLICSKDALCQSLNVHVSLFRVNEWVQLALCGGYGLDNLTWLGVGGFTRKEGGYIIEKKKGSIMRDTIMCRCNRNKQEYGIIK